jgi:hypothetical protein
MMALKDLVRSGREVDLMKENERLRRALRSARQDLVEAIKEIDRELTIHLTVQTGNKS